MSIEHNEKWFWAWLIQMTVAKDCLDNQQAEVEVWKNLIVLRAGTPEQALSKAFEIGKNEQGDCRGSLRLHGKPAVTKFLGVEDIGLIHEEFSDGSEILWQLRKCQQKTARRLSKSKENLLAVLKKEMRQS